MSLHCRGRRPMRRNISDARKEEEVSANVFPGRRDISLPHLKHADLNWAK